MKILVLCGVEILVKKCNKDMTLKILFLQEIQLESNWICTFYWELVKNNSPWPYELHSVQSLFFILLSS